MGNVKWLAAAGLLVSATGCMDLNGNPATSMGGYPGGYPSSGYYGGQPAYSNGGGLLSGLFGQPGYSQPAPTYYQPAPAYYPQAQPAYYPQAQQPAYYPQAQPNYYPTAQPRYVPVPVASPTATARSSGGGRDLNNNGVPDWRERDRNGDGVPDYQQRRRGPTG